MARPTAPVGPGARIGAIFAGCAAAAALVVSSEGWITKVSPDPVGIPTGCAGVTEGMKSGRIYTDDECVALTAQALVKHGAAIDRCIHVPISTETRGAFTSFAYNVGTQAFCTSTAARKLNAGDRRGACAELSRWTKAGGRDLPGLVSRRRAERAMCERGL